MNNTPETTIRYTFLPDVKETDDGQYNPVVKYYRSGEYQYSLVWEVKIKDREAAFVFAEARAKEELMMCEIGLRNLINSQQTRHYD